MTGVGQDGQPQSEGSHARRRDTQLAFTPAPAPALALNDVVLLQRVMSFMALRDPELLAAAAAAVGADSLMPPFSEGPMTEGRHAHKLPVPDP